MILKKVEIFGFKSFANLCTISFLYPITAIVGPNGSGKSNFVDAIRWALGEQRPTALRASKMEDVIFAGSSEMKPLGYAQVSLFFDNENRVLPVDFAEVKISRRIYRSGESEYFINGAEARLRDVSELFYDTGLAREGYSIIGQGKIEELATASAAERRLLIEEAVGIVRYKMRKAESEKKLGLAQANLYRIDDIISELNSRLPSLKRQAEKAQSYLGLRSELKDLEISVFVRRIDELTEHREQISHNKDAIDTSIRAIQSQKEYYEGRLESQKSAMEHFEGDAALAESSRIEAISHYEEARNALRSLQEKELALKISVSELESEAEEYESSLKAALSESKAAAVDLANAQKRASDAESAWLSSSESQPSIAKWEAAQEAKGRLEGYRYVLSRLNEEKELLEAAAAKPGQSSIAEAEAELEAAKKSLNLARYKAADAKNRADAAMQKAISAKAAHESAAASVRAILSRPLNRVIQYAESEPSLKGIIHGAAGDLIEPKDGYSLAVSAALGATYNYLVCESKEGASLIIEKMKSAQWGRATFLPLDIISAHTEHFNISHKGFIGNAASLALYKTEHESAASFLLGRTAVADTLKSALDIAGMLGYRFKVVSLDGSVVLQGGAITGGSSSASAGMSRARELALAREREKEAAAALEQLELERQRAASSIADLENGAELALEAYTEKLARHQSAFSAYEAINLEAGKALSQLAQNQSRRSEIERMAAQDEALVGSMPELYTSQTLSFRASEAEIAYVKASEELERYKERVAYCNSSAASVENALKSKRERVKAAIESLSSINDDIEHAKQMQSMHEASKDSLTEASGKASGSRQQAYQAYMDANEKLLELAKQEAGALEKAYRLESDLAQNAQEARTLKLSMIEQYSVTYAVAASYSTSGSLEEEKGKIDSIKASIARLGSINPNAPEELSELNERLSGLIAQRDDIEKSMSELTLLISDVAKNMAKRFAESFAKIQDEFAKTFTSLFQGGSASLELTDPHDLENSGVDIIASPPNTKPKSIALLSGGEKALCSIALLMAILRLKPSPFCILDEIDAALDETNVARFSAYLREISDENQFVVITHKRKTMQAVDALYGAGMDLNGTSMVVSMSLADLEAIGFA
ncbi:MAG: chromosome segregation protein SMC [Eubacteriaceae bacterium]|nr:chromosome segregation protein SMC [Eubacteriaceae bacterium]